MEQGLVFVAIVAVVVFAALLLEKLDELKREIKAFRTQIQETFTPENTEGGYYGHPKATRQMVEQILNELRRRDTLP